jgi:hypothetical protein
VAPHASSVLTMVVTIVSMVSAGDEHVAERVKCSAVGCVRVLIAGLGMSSFCVGCRSGSVADFHDVATIDRHPVACLEIRTEPVRDDRAVRTVLRALQLKEVRVF